MKPVSLSGVYDKFADSYDNNRDLFNIDHIIAGFQSNLSSETGKLLDLGCGAGSPLVHSFAADSWGITGVDFSEKMVALAKQNVPEMDVIHGDICEVEFPKDHFDAITAIYSLFHVPRQRHGELFGKIHSWLKPGGAALFTYATEDYTGSSVFDGYKEFMGEQLFYSHDDPNNLYGLLEDVGFKVASSEKHTIADETFLWVTVRAM